MNTPTAFIVSLVLIYLFPQSSSKAAGTLKWGVPTIDWEQEEPLSDTQGKIPTIFNFKDYTQFYGKNYDIAEATRKSTLFITRTLRIFQHNVMYMQRKKSYYLGQNEFTDLTPQELSEKYHFSQGIEFEEDMKLPSVHYNPTRLSGENYRRRTSSGNSKTMVDDFASRYQGSESTKPILDFTVEQKIVEEPQVILAQLEAEPHLANFMANIVDLRPVDAQTGAFKSKTTNNVTITPVVDSNNVNYEPQAITSYGLLDNLKLPMMNFVPPSFPMQLPTNTGSSNARQHPFMVGDIELKPFNFDEFKGSIGDAILSGLDPVKDMFTQLAHFNLLEDEWEELPPPTNNKRSESDKEVEFDLDWRNTGCISKPKHQSTCNSCYAFAVLSLMEYFYCRQMNTLTDFSAQYIIDCGSRVQLHGCRGGKINNVGYFIKKYGIELSALYPYSGSEQQCPFSEQDNIDKKTGYLRPQIVGWQRFTDVSVWSQWLKKSPILVGINVPSDFLAYGGGVHTGSNCDQTRTHAMLLVGSGKENGEEFWLLKNSYSELWGEGGYLKLAKSAPSACFNSAVVVRVNFNPKPIESTK